MYQGIDVSKHNGTIDWTKVKANGNSFVMVRLGWTHYAGGLTIDPYSAANILGAQKAGLEVGVYVYSYDQTPQAAVISAKAVLEAVKPYKLTYPIAFDIEDNYNAGLSRQTNSQIAAAFLSPIEQAGYYGILYTYTNFANAYLDMGSLSKYDLWVADYRPLCGYTGKYGMWQYKGQEGRCDGVQGACDLNISYKDYPEIIRKAGLNNLVAKVEPIPEPDYKAKYNELAADLQALAQKYKV